MMNKDASKRITADQILKHCWITQKDILPEYHLPVGKIPASHNKMFKSINVGLRPAPKKSVLGKGFGEFKLTLDKSGLKIKRDKNKHKTPVQETLNEESVKM